MNFLQIVQAVANESDTFGTQITTVVSQRARSLLVVSWSAQAWIDIQNLHSDWLWMEGEFTENTTANLARYTAAAWSITRFGSWITREGSVTIYLTATGVSDESELTEITWDEWRRKYNRGTKIPGRPREFAISPAGEFCLGPIPDADYTVRGLYHKSAQVLTTNTDIPECPVDFHNVIVWKALMLLTDHDEGWPSKAASEIKYDAALAPLERSQLPKIGFAVWPIA